MISIIDFIRQKSLLIKCLTISFLLHLFALFYFYTHPILIHSTWKSLFGLTAATPDILDYEEENSELMEKNKIINEAFHQVLVLSPHFQQPLDLAELPKGIALSPNTENPHLDGIEFDSDMEWEDSSSLDMLASENRPIFHEDSLIQSLFIPEESALNFATQIQIDHEPTQGELPSLSIAENWLDADSVIEHDLLSVSKVLIEASQETDGAGVNLIDRFPQVELKMNEPAAIATDSTSMLGGVEPLAFPEEKSSVSHSYFLAAQTPELTKSDQKMAPPSTLPDLDEYQLPNIAMATSWNDDFNIDLKFLPNEEGSGYIFSVALKPNFDLSEYSLKQNIYFIIDRSNSVQKHRFAVFKRAVLKALASMQNCDAFNIYLIDKSVTKFTSTPLRVTQKAIKAAEEFLDKQDAGTMFAGSDIYGSLEKILPEFESANEFHTAILLTDGNTLHNTPKQQHVLGKWLEKNSGKISLYTAAVGQKNNLLMLDLLSSISGGKLLYSDTHASFPRKLAKLILDLKNPVAKDLMIAAVPQYPDAHIEFYPASSHLPSLYAGHPYMIYGYIDEPCNFDLIIQGRHGEEWIAIKKNVSFIEGEKGTRNLEKQWKAQKANLCYSKFLKEGKNAHLKDAKEILKTNRTEIAFE
ncbi:MAG: VWA domain-containing protein [Parachlamydiales bacterium]|nr:VWA domain-containing protein [Candidatus Acheromyda pituitae]